MRVKANNNPCANCGAPKDLTASHDAVCGKNRFCDACAGLSEALAIGARVPVFLYDDGSGNAVTWTGPIMGRIVHKNAPPRWRRFAPVRYRVRMLDGSMWHGSGPSENGTYIRLRPMKGE